MNSSEDRLKDFLKKAFPIEIIFLIICSIFLALCYNSALNAGWFVYDDLFHVDAARSKSDYSLFHILFIDETMIPVFYYLWGKVISNVPYSAPFALRLINLFIHLANGLLLFSLLKQFLKKDLTSRKWLAFICSLFFIVHPIQVESLVWVSSMKGTLSFLFLFLSFHAIYFSVNDPSEKKRYYYLLLSNLLFLFASFSKPTVVTLSPLYFLYFYYSLRHSFFLSFVKFLPIGILTLYVSYHQAKLYRENFLELIYEVIIQNIVRVTPAGVLLILLIALPGMIFTLSKLPQTKEYTERFFTHPLQRACDRLSLSFVVFVLSVFPLLVLFILKSPLLLLLVPKLKYFTTAVGTTFVKLLAPYPLVFDYGLSPSFIQFGLSFKTVALAILFLGCLLYLIRNKRFKSLKILIVAFILAILPYSGVIHFDFFNISIFADRFAYLPCGIFVAIIFYLGSGISNSISRITFSSVLILFVISFSFLTYHQVKKWKSTESILSHSLTYYPNSVPSLMALGQLYQNQAKIDQALDMYQRVFHINNDISESYISYGELVLKSGRCEDSVEFLEEVFNRSNGNSHPELLNILGQCYLELKDLKKARAYFVLFLALNPKNQFVRELILKIDARTEAQPKP